MEGVKVGLNPPKTQSMRKGKEKKKKKEKLSEGRGEHVS